MPKILKNTIPHILISLFVAPIMLLAFSWTGSEFMGTRDIKILVPSLEKKIDKILLKQDRYLRIMVKNQNDISYLKGRNEK